MVVNSQCQLTKVTMSENQQKKVEVTEKLNLHLIASIQWQV